jgi:hypothetical protein
MTNIEPTTSKLGLKRSTIRYFWTGASPESANHRGNRLLGVNNDYSISLASDGHFLWLERPQGRTAGTAATIPPPTIPIPDSFAMVFASAKHRATCRSPRLRNIFSQQEFGQVQCTYESGSALITRAWSRYGTRWNSGSATRGRDPAASNAGQLGSFCKIAPSRSRVRARWLELVIYYTVQS